MKSNDNTALACLGALALLVILPPIAYSISGYVVSVLWGWFLVPLGLPVLSIPHAIGISLIVCYCTHQMTAHKDDRDKTERITAYVFSLIVNPCLVLLVGWIIKGLM